MLFRRLRGSLRQKAVVEDRAIGDDHLAGLDDLLEAAQVVADLLRRLFAEELGERRADDTARRRVVNLDADMCAASARRAREADGAFVVNVRAFERAPRDQFSGAVVRDFRVPLDRRTRGRFRLPVRAARARLGDRLQMLHEARQVLEVVPELIKLFGRAVDDDALAYANRASRRLFAAAELLRADHADPRPGDHVPGREREPALARTRRSEGRAEAREV